MRVEVAVVAPGDVGWTVLTRDGSPPGGAVDGDERPTAAACRLSGLDLAESELVATRTGYAALLPERPREGSWCRVDGVALSDDVRALVPTSPEVVLRSPVPADTDAIVALHHAALDAVGANAGPGDWDDDLADIAGHYRGGGFVVGSLGGFVLAMGALRPVGDGVAEIKRMRVRPRWQGRGLGRRVLAHLERRAVDLGFRALTLDTTEHQRAAIALYAGSGYVPAGTGVAAGMPALFFRKDL